MSFLSDLKTVIANRFFEPRLGDRGERAAADYLKKRCRMIILERSYRNYVGEIDLIAADRRSKPATVVFVEVKTRTSDRAGHPSEAVDERKQRQITETALVWLRQNHLLEHRCRFDIVSIIWPDGHDKPLIEHFENAFEPVGVGQMFN
jgi:putative endonuclease